MSKVSQYLGMLRHSTRRHVYMKKEGQLFEADTRAADRFRLMMTLHLLATMLFSFLLFNGNPEIFGSTNWAVDVGIKLLTFAALWFLILPFASLFIVQPFKMHFKAVKEKIY
ncbi:MAG: hypothetical protein PUJ57_02025 [Peptoniphilaceae bacterium]|nr:hypothetical protein [Peptoniphilaceae bacterium]MDY6085465.1 hypothetical protein [Peptoniphilaceae bacterium]